MSKAQETVLEIDLKALAHNYHFLRSKLQKHTKFLAVVKAFAYGSDSVMVARHLEDLGVDYFAVAYVKEGVVLRDAGISKPILVLHPQPVNFKILIERCLEPSIYSETILTKFIATASEAQQANYPIHIKFNTGLNRLGFRETDVDLVCKILSTTNSVKIASVFSHLAASEDLNEKPFTEQQIQCFNRLAKTLSDRVGYAVKKHLCNTSGILNYPEAHFDMVRSGIGLYGFGNDARFKSQLKPIATLKSVISQIHHIEPGESVGYNRAFVSDAFMKTATIPIGHADGIGRQYGQKKGAVTINGASAPILGNVCMDMIMVDVTQIDCEEGDEVMIFGKSPTASEFAQKAGTISYEIITAISSRVKRSFLK